MGHHSLRNRWHTMHAGLVAARTRALRGSDDSSLISIVTWPRPGGRPMLQERGRMMTLSYPVPSASGEPEVADQARYTSERLLVFTEPAGPPLRLGQLALRAKIFRG
jgi:hypothetical protein